MKVAVLLNRSAGTIARANGDLSPQRIEQAFAACGVTAQACFADPATLAVALRRLLQRGNLDAIVVGGGDGTINAAASVLAGSQVPLGVLPLGTFNHFAKDYGIPLDLEGAARIIAGGHVREIGVGEVNGRMFLNSASIGLYPDAVRHRELQQQRHGRAKWLAMTIASARALQRFRRLAVRLRVGGQSTVRRTSLVVISGNRFVLDSYGLHGLDETPGMHLFVTRDLRRLDFLNLGLRAVVGRPPPRGSIDVLELTEATIESRRPHLRVGLDGEVVMLAPPLQFRHHPQKLRVLVPGGDAPKREEQT